MPRPLGPVPRHGTRARYQLRGDPCRCTRCRTANRRYQRAYRAARRPYQLTLPDKLIPRPKAS